MAKANQRDSEEDEEDYNETAPSYLSSLLSGFLRNWSCIRRVHNMLNIPSQSFPAPSSQQRVSPSGQSGRNKVTLEPQGTQPLYNQQIRDCYVTSINVTVALKPGHSLMDWVRFAKSGKDLTGLRGRLIEVTQDELQKHNKRDDCWTCIRGMVYNVTPYMDYHPGGEEELMKAAGIDGTDFFDQVHRWVNYESMLKECLVGRMATKAATPGKAIIPPPSLTGLAPPAAGPPPPNKDSRPRKIPSSGCVTVDLKAGILRMEVLLGKLSYMMHLCLADEVEENVSVHTASSVGKIQLTIHKQTKGKWTSLGQPLEFHNTFLCKKDRGLFYRDCTLVSKTEVNHNTHVFRLQFPRGTVMHVPVGKHVYLKALIEGTEIVRPYTPVDQNLVAVSPSSSHKSDLHLMIKVYPDGVFSPYLNSLQIGENISISGPDGTFSLRPLRDVTHLYLLAAGTGFTPMARLISLALREIDTISRTKLLFFNKREEDILWHCRLDDLAANDERFQVEYVLSEPPGSWTGRKGRVDETMLREFLIRPDGSRCYVCVCGPSAFTEQTTGLLKQLGFSEEECHAFQG
ncbi:cytochrome b5 reductase 4 isoform X3 [Girardinichthys multiradiatus]|uniref:cytochrome b5 reductase 4 isoform X3 n=1 Tax=Girardinichthys multiradiatus TaxID=208333 RepID=UPI001FABED01|nr:cytochrome b5 reductase 4 isoform X3 [Girardinichthys multiradiatus]